MKNILLSLSMQSWNRYLKKCKHWITIQKSFKSKINKHAVCGYSIFTQFSSDATKSKHDFYSGEDSTKNFCGYLREHATIIINCKNSEMIPLKNNRKNHIAHKNFVTYAKKNLKMMIQIIKKFFITVITQAYIEVQHKVLQPKMQKTKENPMVL